ncbi:penicillin-binding transpeptidase domain-containing protein [Acidimicrobiia bacterium]|jgi:penicillin-binding protein 2|nr:penicillin-binding transpeptidase domain-containing protein [Acidimicrobiia bacterium]MDA8719892.1 penicillin-binding transpeptidase domain-containing protein [Candidatus Actinomarina sp.]MDA7548400.1 penicillin-binding transpeptidase domain-containing protein [Acidimicrobiia bacterium]MDA8922485.1 penicillin-binding transpeptidase domain-containing protein [Acidimicrobiia bacterium]MDA9173776.1 penicillin-binding transpeptidase domain-containing protein [Acidimicrobiia bacterium]|tara:strand:+ start:5365 stop:7200 length:1836 start_codon:yes stop_codon:yes gene_type:complete
MFFQQKFRLLTTLIGIIFLTLLFNVYNLQTSDREASLVSVNKQTLDTFYIPSPRGEIFDANNNKLVSSSLEPHLFLNLRKINDNNRSQYEQYVKYNFVDLSEDFIDEIFESEDLLIRIANIQNLNFDSRQSLASLEAFEIFDFPVRKYEYNNIASHIVGYLGEPSFEDARDFPLSIKPNIVGKSGLERYYQDDLAGIPTEIIFKDDEIEQIIKGTPGKDIFTSLDIKLQTIATESLLQGIELANGIYETKNKVQRGAIVVLDIRTNEVISLVSLPDYNPNNFIDGISRTEFNKLNISGAFINYSIQGQYPPGSVFKVVAYWLAEEENIYPEGLSSRNQRINCKGSLSFGFDDGSQQVYNDWKEDGHGNVDLGSSIKQSCNVYFWDIALKIWRDYEGSTAESILQEYAKSLGFGTATNIDLPYEADGVVADRELFENWAISQPERVRPEGWLGGDLMNLIIGQGAITSTPIQVANAYRTLISGNLSYPYINKNRESQPEESIGVTEDFVNFLLKDLNSVTNEGGTAHASFSILGNEVKDVGGKTGTAQNSGDKNNTSWFVGVDSVSNPRYIIATVVEEGGSGSAIAAPVTRRVIQSLREMEITPVKFGEITE